MKKLELTIVRNAVANRETTDIFTERQAETVRNLAEAGIVRIERDEKLKANMVVMTYKGGTEATVRASENAEAQSEETEEETESE